MNKIRFFELKWKVIVVNCFFLVLMNFFLFFVFCYIVVYEEVMELYWGVSGCGMKGFGIYKIFVWS